MPEPPDPSRGKTPRKPSVLLNPVSLTGDFRPKESRAELESRLRMAEAASLHAREQEIRKTDREEARDRLILRFGLAAISVVGIYCLVLNALPHPSLEQRAWATSTLTGMVGGMIGYVVGTSKK